MYFYPLNLEAIKNGTIQGVLIGLAGQILDMAIHEPSIFLKFAEALKQKRLPTLEIYKNDIALEYSIFNTSITIPTYEDIIFNGLILQLTQSVLEYADIPYSAPIAIAASALGFSLVHVGNLSYKASVFKAGLFYGTLAYLNESLWPSTIAHMANNALVCFLYRSGVFNVGVYDILETGDGHKFKVIEYKVKLGPGFDDFRKEQREDKREERTPTSLTGSIFNWFKRYSQPLVTAIVPEKSEIVMTSKK